MLDEIVWVEKYRPRKLEDCVLPQNFRLIFEQIIEDGIIPNLLFASRTPGVGKTTVAKILCETLDYDYIMINGSNDRNIDTLRDKITGFASSVSIDGLRKCVIIDEADHLNPQSTQPALKSFIEEYSSNCVFIFTCNQINKLSSPIRSRFAIMDFDFEVSEERNLKMGMLERAETILNAENVEYDKRSLAKIVSEYYPEFRSVIGELQLLSKNGKIEKVSFARTDSMDDLIDHLRAKDWTKMRKWTAENYLLGIDFIANQLTDKADSFIVDNKKPEFFIIAYDYIDKHTRAGNPEICIVAMLSELLLSCDFK